MGVPSKHSLTNVHTALCATNPHESKPETAQKLLSRIDDSPVCDEIIAAIVSSSLSIPNLTVSSATTISAQENHPRPFSAAYDVDCTDAAGQAAHVSIHGHAHTPQEVAIESGGQKCLVSPLHIVTAIITSNSEPRCDGLGAKMTLQSGGITSMALIKARLAKYFGT
ncbi:hypothetical protein BFJ72_g14996 [Fusarium proliferatum]|uniref:Uncharacterized protein n=1 Tax=Gibberella intermedia TaxID=948311 RepID=A0A420RV76_GIBIN|nr:hypothetical protein FPRO03_14231 [Fusarium proliferatum]RKL20835.1 hypothetical protein BFJ72_g14996 [Fusarium proliferatum]